MRKLISGERIKVYLPWSPAERGSIVIGVAKTGGDRKTLYKYNMS